MTEPPPSPTVPASDAALRTALEKYEKARRGLITELTRSIVIFDRRLSALEQAEQPAPDEQ